MELGVRNFAGLVCNITHYYISEKLFIDMKAWHDTLSDLDYYVKYAGKYGNKKLISKSVL